MQNTVAALTMVRDDAFFLKAWLRHYGETLGRENCYIINHGRGTEVSQLAEGCNVIGIPGDPHPNFDMKRWRLLNNTVQGLRCYYDHVIVGDVDELLVVDPEHGGGLVDFLRDMPIRQVLTPVGLEVVHRVAHEPAAIGDHVLGPRMHVRVAPHYSKPCVISLGTKIARGGHFTQSSKLHTPDALLLFHLKFCDFGNYVETMNRRNAVTEAVGGDVQGASIGRHWFAEARGEDRAVFDAFSAQEVAPFDLTGVRRGMHRSWKARGDTGFWQFDRKESDQIMALPERFSGLL